MKKILSFALCALMFAGIAFAQDSGKTEQSFWISVDFAEYLQSDALAASGTNWAPVTGPYSGIEGRITPWYELKIKTPGSNALTAGNNIKLQQGLEITPVSVVTKSKVVYEPIAFLNFSAGANVGTGWNVGPFKGGMGVFDGLAITETGTSINYAALKPFGNYYIEPWAEALFQFDVAALIGDKDLADKMHIVLQTTYKVAYTTLTGVENETPWIWQLAGNRFNGLNYDSVITLGYALPSNIKVLNLVGVQVEFSGFYKDVDANPYYNSKFTNIGISPTAVLKFNAHNSLAIQCRIKNRLSYVDPTFTNACGVNNGTEWIFDRFALSYTWKM